MADPFVDKKLWLCLSEIELLSSLQSITDSVQQLAGEGTDLAGPAESIKARCHARIVTCKTVHHIISMAIAAHDPVEGRPAIISLDHDMVETLRLGLRLFFALNLLEDDAEGATHSAFVALLDKIEHFSSCPDDFDTDDDEDHPFDLDVSCQLTNKGASEGTVEPEFAIVEPSAKPRSLQRSISSLNLLSPGSPTAYETPALQDVNLARPLSSLGMAAGSKSASGQESTPVTPPRLLRPLSAIVEVDEIPSTPRHNYNMSASFAFQSPIFSYDKPSNLRSLTYNPSHFSLDNSDSDSDSDSSSLHDQQSVPSSSQEGSPNYIYTERPTSSFVPRLAWDDDLLFADDVSSPLAFGASTSTNADPLPSDSGNPAGSTDEPSGPTWTSSSPIAHDSSSPLQFGSSTTSSTTSTEHSSQSEAGSDRPLVQADTQSTSRPESRRERRRRLREERREQRRQRKEKEKIVIHDPAFVEHLRDNGFL